MAHPSSDPFDTLGLPARFDLAPKVIQEAYLKRSGVLHPDVTGSNDPEAEAAAARLNEAKRVLQNPETRAEALLSRLGGPRKEADRSLPPAFLAQMLEVREAIEQAGDTAGEQTVNWEAWAEERRRGHLQEVGRLFGALRSPPDPTILKSIRLELNMWRYVERLIEQLDRT